MSTFRSRCQIIWAISYIEAPNKNYAAGYFLLNFGINHLSPSFEHAALRQCCTID